MNVKYSGSNYVYDLTNSTSHPAKLARLYKGLLGRLPDNKGAAYWMAGINEGVLDWKKIANNFIYSKEFRTKYGTTHDAIVTALYKNVLDRSPDEAGFNYWKRVIANAGIPTVVYGFTESLEFSKKLGRLVIPTAWAGHSSNRQNYTFRFNLPRMPYNIKVNGSSATMTRVSAGYKLPTGNEVYYSGWCSHVSNQKGLIYQESSIQNWKVRRGRNFACIDTTNGYSGARRQEMINFVKVHEIAHLWQVEHWGWYRFAVLDLEKMANCVSKRLVKLSFNYTPGNNPSDSYCQSMGHYVNTVVNSMH